MQQPAPKLPPIDLRDYSAMRCPIHGLLTLLNGPWTTYILWMIRVKGEMRFGQLKKQMPAISAKVLTERLRMLEKAGIVSRRQEATIPPKVTYSFTARGRQLGALLDDINVLVLAWSNGESNAPAPESGGREHPPRKSQPLSQPRRRVRRSA
jgi:DNA-binding HxlR family transcriptional regulator